VADGRYIKNVFGHNSAADCAISAKFCTGKQHVIRRHVTYTLSLETSQWPMSTILLIVKSPISIKVLHGEAAFSQYFGNGTDTGVP